MLTYRKNPDALDATVGQSMVVLNLDSLKYYELTEVAARIWELLGEAPFSQHDLCQALLAEYDVDEAECVSAIATFLEDSTAKGLVLSE
jgi:hypothetical protein